MDFYEVEGKRLMVQYGIPADEGILCSQTTDLDSIGLPCVLKAQVLSGKRGKAGGIQTVKEREELIPAIERVRSVRVNGKTPVDVLAVPMLQIAQEHYLGCVIDRAEACVVLLYTPFGGMEIEELAAKEPDKLARIATGRHLEHTAWRQAVEKFQQPEELSDQIYEIAVKLVEMFFALDATTLEINPLAYTTDGRLVAADAKLVVDDNALYRQTGLELFPRQEEDEANKIAREAGFAFVELGQGGTIGVVGGGAGVGMATIDAIRYHGEYAYNFSDLGSATLEKTYRALKLLFDTSEVRGVVVNVFGGGNNCLTMAQGVERAYLEAKEQGTLKPLVVKSRGFNQEEGWAIYDRHGIPQVRYGTTDDAVKKLLDILANQGGDAR